MKHQYQKAESDKTYFYCSVRSSFISIVIVIKTEINSFMYIHIEPNSISSLTTIRRAAANRIDRSF